MKNFTWMLEDGIWEVKCGEHVVYSGPVLKDAVQEVARWNEEQEKKRDRVGELGTDRR
jgi:hypothetical protein